MKDYLSPLIAKSQGFSLQFFSVLVSNLMKKGSYTIPTWSDNTKYHLIKDLSVVHRLLSDESLNKQSGKHFQTLCKALN